MSSALSLSDAIIHHSPGDIAGWPVTLRVTHVDEVPRWGFALTSTRKCRASGNGQATRP
jgi:hypothetical protein